MMSDRRNLHTQPRQREAMRVVAATLSPTTPTPHTPTPHTPMPHMSVVRWRRFGVAAVPLPGARDIGAQGRKLLAEQVYLALQREDIQLLSREGIAEFAQRVALERGLGLERSQPPGDVRLGTATAVIATGMAPG